MDIFKKHSLAERDAAIKEARDAYDGVDPELQHMIAPSDNDFLAKVEAAITVAPIEIAESRPLTTVEKAALDTEQDLATLFHGAYKPREYSAIPAFAEMEKAEERQDL